MPRRLRCPATATAIAILTLEHALARAADCFADQALWQGMQKRGMASDVSWGRSAQVYAHLYRNLLKA
jgi:starch synthase